MHKLDPATEGPLRVVSVTDATVVVRKGEKQEQVSTDIVVGAPSAAELIRKKVIQNEKFVINCIVDHSNKDGKWRFRVRWYGLASTDDIW